MESSLQELGKNDLSRNSLGIWMRITAIALSIAFTGYILRNILYQVSLTVQLGSLESSNSVVRNAMSSIWLIFLWMAFIALFGWGLYFHKLLTEKEGGSG